MATIADLRTSISEMDDQEAFDLIKSIRFIRRQPQPKKARRSPAAKRSPKKKLTPLELAGKLTPEQAQELLKQLTGEG